MKEYNPTEIEKKWQKYWDEKDINPDDESKEKFYCLDMFPYPSGSGLHVGHWRGYVFSDVLSRYKLMQGFNVLHPMGWDAFGLPAENYAIEKNIHPKKAVEENIIVFKRQLKEIGAMYSWDREINTTDPDYYKWTQWIFARMFDEGLAYEEEKPLNWCPHCKVVLANEEATNGQCERCKSEVTKKTLRQWMLRITKYSDRLLDDLEQLKWSSKVKKMQSDWIGRSYGAEINFEIIDSDETIKAFTTRADTLYGATFMILAPEHDLVKQIVSDEQRKEVENYVYQASTKSSIDRMSDKNKTGVFTGRYSINPINNEKMPIWISDYVLIDYGTGAIMSVPAHDQRDFEFASKFNLEIVEVISKDGQVSEKLEEAYVGEGFLVNSDKFDGLTVEEGIEKISDYLEKENLAKKTINYKLRDWVFSRQRYWGEPIPIIHCDDCGAVRVPDEDLPVILPDVESYKPTDTGQSPLASIDSWLNTACPKCGKNAKRETNTMPQWAGSSWYFLRYADNNNNEVLASDKSIKRWSPVDMYVGGIEHAVLHLLYARFYTKFLFDIGVVDFQEPFSTLFNQGMVTRNGAKMSKSVGNTISPDGLVDDYGCDSLRMYELFVGPAEQDSEWDDRGIEGVSRFLNRFWKLIYENKDSKMLQSKESKFIENKMIYEIRKRIDGLSLNTVVSGFMEFTNSLIDLEKKQKGLDKETLKTMIKLIAPLAPHIAEELWQELGGNNSIFLQEYPMHIEELLKEDVITMAIQINGKLRGNIEVEADIEKDLALAKAKLEVSRNLEGKNIVKEIFVPGKIINFVVK